MEKVKEFQHYVVIVKFQNDGYWLRDYTKEKLEKLVAVRYDKCRYVIDKSSSFSLHGWYPWLKENRWNAWRNVYNMLYRYFIPCGLLYYEEPKTTTEAMQSVSPASWIIGTEKWTPTLVQAVNLSKRESDYNKRLRPAFSNFPMNWKVMLIIGIVVIVALLIITGRLPL